MINKQNKFYASIRIVLAIDKQEAEEKIKNGEFVETHKYSDKIIKTNKLFIKEI